MSKFDRLKQKYDSLVKEAFIKNKQILIESFVQYYGEEYRTIIEKRYNEITFIYYIDWEMVDLVMKDFIPEIDNPEKYSDFIRFSKSRKKSFLSNMFRKNDNVLPDNFIGTTNENILNKSDIVEWIKKALKRSEPCSCNIGSIREMNRLIAFQILPFSEEVIIHEINHALTRDNIAYIMDDEYPIGAISKTGLSVDVDHNNNGERNIEELLNEKASKEITKIFKSKGGDFSSFCLDVPLAYIYEFNLYLVDDFYEKFKQYIKVARISDNKNALVARIGKNEYDELVTLINNNYSEDSDECDRNKEQLLPIIDKILERMKRNVDESNADLNDRESYLKHLKELGYTLRTLTKDIESETKKIVSDEIENTKKSI